MSDPSVVHAFANPGEGHLIDCVHPHTGRSWINGLTLEEIRARDPKDANAEKVLINDWLRAKAARQDEPVTWDETTEERYHEMLEVLPPAFWKCGAFMVGEASDHHAGTGFPRFATFRKVGGKYFEASRPMRVSELCEVLGITHNPRRPAGDYQQ